MSILLPASNLSLSVSFLELSIASRFQYILHNFLADNMVVWDCKPEKKDAPINWVELKTSAEMYTDKDLRKYERKLLKFWAQSFLLGVPKIVVGFRSMHGILERLEEVETRDIPGNVKRLGRGTWDGNICINFTAQFLECMTSYPVLAYPLILPRAQNDHQW